MDLSQLAQVGEFIGGIAVLVTLVYLAIQVRSTRNDLSYRGSIDFANRIYQAYAPVYEGRNAEILFQGLTADESISPVDEFVFDLLMRRHLGALSEGLREFEAGVISQELVDFMGAHYRKVFTSKPGGRAWILENQEEFLREIELFDLLSSNTES